MSVEDLPGGRRLFGINTSASSRPAACVHHAFRVWCPPRPRRRWPNGLFPSGLGPFDYRAPTTSAWQPSDTWSGLASRSGWQGWFRATRPGASSSYNIVSEADLRAAAERLSAPIPGVAGIVPGIGEEFAKAETERGPSNVPEW